MTLCPRKCPKCNSWMYFEMLYCAGIPVTNWYCDECGFRLNESYTIEASNNTVEVEQYDKC